jgi:hypothetical protein
MEARSEPFGPLAREQPGANARPVVGKGAIHEWRHEYTNGSLLRRFEDRAIFIHASIRGRRSSSAS